MVAEIPIIGLPLKEPTSTARNAKTKVLESGFFTEDFLNPSVGTEIFQDASGELIRVGADLDGDFFFIEPTSKNKRKVIIHDRFYRRQRFEEKPLKIRKKIIKSIKTNSNHQIENIKHVHPLHRESQETSQTFSRLYDFVLEDGNQGKFTPFDFLEVYMKGSNGDHLGCIDELKRTSVGRFWVVEHALDLESGGISKYRQVEGYGIKFSEKYKIPANHIGTVCFITSELSPGCLFTTIAYANPLVSVV